MKSNSLLIILALLNSASALAASELSTYTYDARTPATDLSCDAAAQALAEKVKLAAPKAERVQSRCVARTTFKNAGEQFSVDNLQVTYSSDYAIMPTTAQFPSYDFHAYHLYPKYRDCLNDLSVQTALFTKATGLSPLSASCLPGVDANSGFTLKIEAVGTPARTIYAFQQAPYGRLADNLEWKNQILEFIAQSGGIVAKTTHDMIAYYAPAGTVVRETTWLHTDTMEQCQSQIGEISSMLHKLGAKNILAQCHSDVSPESHVTAHYYLDTVQNGAMNVYFNSTYGQTFFTFDECMAVRQNFLDREPAAKAWTGSFCTVSDYGQDRYNLISITRF